jgi:hypothetical protein
MAQRNFWLAVAAGTAAYFIIIQITIMLTVAAAVGRLVLPALHWEQAELLRAVVVYLTVCLLTGLIYTVSSPSKRNLRAGFQIGACCGLLMFVRHTVYNLFSGESLMSEFTNLFSYGICGGVAGAIFAHMLGERPAANAGSRRHVQGSGGRF